MNDEPHNPAPGRRRILLVSAVSLLVAAMLIAFLALHSRSGTRDEESEREAAAKKGVKAETAVVKRSPTERTVLLTGETRPYYSVTLYARVSGYMDQLHADIGDPVKKGQLLAHVQAPEQEQAFQSARANAVNLTKISQRMRILYRQKLVSQQQMEQAVSNADVAQAGLKTQAVIRDYQNIVAPFDGVVTERFVDPGNLLQNASAAQSASQPLFTITQSDRLRIFVYVDQRNAPYVKAGDAVEIIVPNQATEHFQTQVQMVAGALDPKTRTLLTEMVLENPGNQIVAGSFVQVRIRLQTPPYLSLPVQALVMKAGEPYVPVIGEGGELKLTPVVVAENDGENLLIRSGVTAGQKVALNIGNTQGEGAKLQPVAEAKPAETAPPGKAPGPGSNQAAGTRQDGDSSAKPDQKPDAGDSGSDKDKGDHFDKSSPGGSAS